MSQAWSREVGRSSTSASKATSVVRTTILPTATRSVTGKSDLTLQKHSSRESGTLANKVHPIENRKPAARSPSTTHTRPPGSIYSYQHDSSHRSVACGDGTLQTLPQNLRLPLPDNQVMLCRSGITLRDPAFLVRLRLRDYVPHSLRNHPSLGFLWCSSMETGRYCD
jgi:hypothetical protein